MRKDDLLRPPDRPEPALIDDGYYVEEPVEPRLPFWGWDSMRDRWQTADQRPVSRRLASVVVLVCVAIVAAVLILLVAAPRSAAVNPVSGRSMAPGDTAQPQNGAPSPSEGLAGPRYSAQATYCAPTPDYCQSWGEPAKLAAVNSFTFGDRPYWVRVTRGTAFTDALVVSYCACQGRDDRIDLSPAAFALLAPLSRGRIDVEVERLAWPYEPGGDPPPHPDDERLRIEDGGPGPTLPPTDATP